MESIDEKETIKKVVRSKKKDNNNFQFKNNNESNFEKKEINNLIDFKKKKDNNQFKNNNESNFIMKTIENDLTKIIKEINLFKLLYTEYKEEDETIKFDKTKELLNECKEIFKDIKNKNKDILEKIRKALISKEKIEISFLIDTPIFNQNNVKLLYDTIKNIINIFKEIDISQNHNIFEIIVNCLITKLQSNYNGSDENNTIKYIYDIIKDLIEIKDIARSCANKNIIALLLTCVEKEYESNQTKIFDIIKTVIKETKDYDKHLFYKINLAEDKNIKGDVEEFKEKNTLRQMLTITTIELLFDKDIDLLLILIRMLEYQDKAFSDKCNLEFLPNLLKYSKKNDKLIRFIKLCINIIDIKDDLCIERMKQILGFPVLIVKPKNYSYNKGENNQEKWPLFGAKLIFNNNNDLKTEIYKYICFYRKQKFCILSYLLPSTSANEENIKKDEVIPEEIINSLINELITKTLREDKNYCLFKYLYLLPARSLSFKNAYEELINVLDKEKKYNLSDTKEIEKLFIEKIKYELNEVYSKRNPNSKEKSDTNIQKPVFSEEILEYNKDIEVVSNFTGFIPDYIPGEIAKSEIQSIVRTPKLELIRIDYYTKYYDIDEFKNKIITQNSENKVDNINEKKIETSEVFDEKEKIITVDISNKNYQKDENRLINNISKKLEEAKKFIINDGVLDNNNTINSFIRYILINKKPFNNEIKANIEFNQGNKTIISDNICISELIYDYVGRHNYVDVLDINRIKKDENFLKNDDLFISINSKTYLSE
jgi:hypothetical protein